ELWKSDGTVDGTTIVKNITAGGSSTFSSQTLHHFINFGGTLYFTRYTGNAIQLWKSDGTSDGTVQVTSFSANSSARWLTVVGSKLFFTTSTVTTGEELWVSDGTAGGTAMVKNIGAGNFSGVPSGITAYGNSVVFAASD